MALTIDDFEEFFFALTQHSPFPWQGALARQVWQTKSWNLSLAIPTGLGKTSILLIAIFLLALEAHQGGERKFPLRIFFVVDRRVVVGQVTRHAEILVERLEAAKSGLLFEVAQALLSIGAPGQHLPRPPVGVSRLQGGIPLQERWAKRPDIPFIVMSTVDQVGSMLLHQGYRHGALAKPIHTGLVANDILLILDEVHLSSAFATTLERIHQLQERSWPSDLPLRRGTVFMSATHQSTQTFGLSDQDLKHPIVLERLTARKEFELLEIPVRLNGDLKKLIQGIVEATDKLVQGGAKRVLVVLNQVALAREVFTALEYPKTLLMGRQHALGRQELLDACLPKISADRKEPDEDVFVVVSTQVVEVGADFDFDGMVTECAPLDALIQRFGRLNRMGRWPNTKAVIVGRSDHVTQGSPIYGEALGATWEFLKNLPGRKSQDLILDPVPRELLAPQAIPPLLSRSHLDHLVQTTPPSGGAPDLAPFLHGVGKSNPDVFLVWREDLFDDEDFQNLQKRLQERPPTEPEMVPVPVWEAAAWALGSASSDLEGEDMEPDKKSKFRPIYRFLWESVGRKRKGSVERITEGRALRPGDILLIPASYGGLDKWGWNPGSVEVVEDVGTSALWQSRGKAACWISKTHPDLGTELEDDQEILQTLLLDSTVNPQVLNHLQGRDLDYSEAAHGRGVLVWAQSDPSEKDLAWDEDSRSKLSREVSLEEHSQGVRHWAAAFARAANLPTTLIQDLAIAGLVHDLGKALPHWQAMACASTDTVIAKGLRYKKWSSCPGMSRGWRHEMLSLALLRGHEELLGTVHDPELVQYLVLSHHGWGRPFAPAVEAPKPTETVHVTVDGLTFSSSTAETFARVDSIVPLLFHRMVRKYGWWGLTWLEAMFRLADHHESMLEELPCLSST